MIRAQVQFEGQQYQRLRQAAARRGVSIAQLVREGVDAYLARVPADRWDDLLAVAGKYGKDGSLEEVGQRHDRYLDEAYEDWRESS
jgi:hypothetical protein